MCIRVWPLSSRKGLFLALLALTTQNTPKTTKINIAENQVVNKKSAFFCIFFAKKFGQFKNLLYLCIRFRSKMGHAPKELKQMIFEKMSIHNKIVVQELNEYEVHGLVP